MSKRILAVLLVLVLALGLMGTGAFAAEGTSSSCIPTTSTAACTTAWAMTAWPPT